MMHTFNTLNTFIQDESLFGSPARFKQMTGNRSWGGSSAPDLPLGSLDSGSPTKKTGRRRMSNDPEVVQVITNDLIRKIRYTDIQFKYVLVVLLDVLT